MEDKENIAEGLQVTSRGPSPVKKASGRKTRSKSIGPGGLDDAPLKEDTGNRRKSTYIPSGILPSKEDEKKRREARRKSLANRRVSFAPEATLHTWDVIEYMDNATTSSASSNSTRRNSTASQGSGNKSPSAKTSSLAKSGDVEPPSTPPEQLEEPIIKESPVSQREAHQKKRRRSSGIPPLDFNNPEDVFSSSPVEGNSDDEVEDENRSHAPNASEENETSDHTSDSIDSTSARLEQALRQAVAQAGTRGIDYDENGDMSMEIADEEVTAAFKPWIRTNTTPGDVAEDRTASFDQENINPFSPIKSTAPDKHASMDILQVHQDDAEDASMDITRAVGGIVSAGKTDTIREDEDDATMDMTTALGGIKETDDVQRADRRTSLKRRRSSNASLQQGTTDQGSPAKKQSRRSSMRTRRQSADASFAEDETMDFTMVVGSGIKQLTAIDTAAAAAPSIDIPEEDQTMDFTISVGGIRQNESSQKREVLEDDSGDEIHEDLSMELTAVIGGIQKDAAKPTTPLKTPVKSPSTPRTKGASPTKPFPAAIQPSPRRTLRRSLLSLPPTTPDDLAKTENAAERSSQLVLGLAKEPNDQDVHTPTPKTVHFNEMLMGPEKTPTPSKGILKASKIVSHSQDAGVDAVDELQEEPTLSNTAALFNSIKALSTPRKQVQPSPAKRSTPKKEIVTKKEQSPQKVSSPKKRTPRKSLSPKKQVRIEENIVAAQEPEQVSESSDVERIRLQDFLDMTNIRFMDLTTTKRRHTAAPTAFLNKRTSRDLGDQDEQPSLASCVAAAACTAPEFEMYQHACHELKKYIAGGKDVVRQIEAEVAEENPPLFSEFLSAPPDQRYVISNQLKNMKTNARLQSKKGWYQWRSTLLRDLQAALVKTDTELTQDDVYLLEQEQMLDSMLPELSLHQKQLKVEHQHLQQRADELLSCDKDELDATREKIVSVESELLAKKQLLQELQDELMQKDANIEAVKERKLDCVSEIQEAERVREECRGWSATEVNTLKDKVTALEEKYGWTIASAGTSPTRSLTMAYASDLQLYFHPLSFAPNDSETPNSPISLTYIGDSASSPRPLTTAKRFFLQCLRAHLQCLTQSTTTISYLLATVKAVWTTALAITEGIRHLEFAGICDETILSDERMAIGVSLVLPSLRTKVRVTFEIGVGISGGDQPSCETSVRANVEVIYGERYKENTMTDFVNNFVGDHIKEEKEMAVWGDAVRDLKSRLIAKGPKGERV